MPKQRILKISAGVLLLILFTLLFGQELIKNSKDYANISISLSKSGRKIFGFEKQQRYLLVFQNTAEARGTGGIIGGYAVINVKDGNFIVETSATSGLKQASELPVKLPNEFYDLYNDDPSIWQNSNLSIHFPYAAQIWLELWKRQSGQELDGLLTVDPTLISYILKVTGPISMADGTVINAKNVVNETLSEVYKKYEFDNNLRKQFLLDLMNETFIKIQNISKWQKIKLIPALLKGYQEQRLLFFHTDKKIQKSQFNLKSSGILHQRINNDFRAVIINTSGNKLDYYLRRKVELNQIACSPNKTRVKVTIKNTASPDKKLPNYVAGRLDLGLISGKRNSQGIALLIYGPYGSNIDQIRNFNNIKNVSIASELGHPVAVFQLNLKAQSEEQVELDFLGGEGELQYIDQPLSFKTDVTLKSNC